VTFLQISIDITGPTSANLDYLEGFSSGEFVAQGVFNWPESPDIHSKPKK
jgi:hypothetical protein